MIICMMDGCGEFDPPIIMALDGHKEWSVTTVATLGLPSKSGPDDDDCRSHRPLQVSVAGI
jgi:hypothetical protein